MKKIKFLFLLFILISSTFTSLSGQVSTSDRILKSSAGPAALQSDKIDLRQDAPSIKPEDAAITIPVIDPPEDNTRAARTASVSGNWNNTATWGGSSVPVAGDAVTINNGITVTVNVAAECASITTVNTGTITISGTNSLTVSGLVYMARPGSNNTNFTIAVGAGTATFGSLRMLATTTSKNNIITVSTGTLTVIGALITGTTGSQLTLTSTGIIDLQGARSTYTPSITAVSGSTVKIGTGSVSSAQLTAMTLPAGSTLEYSGAASQAIFATTYTCNLAFSGAGTKTLATSALLQANGNVTNGSTIVLAAGTSTTSTRFYLAKNYTNNQGGFIDDSADYTTFYFMGTTAQTFTNNSTFTTPIALIAFGNSAGLTLMGSEQIVVTRVNLYYGTITNSNQLTFGNGGTSYGVVQIGSSTSYPRGYFDQSPTFDLGDGGMQLLYAPASASYSTSYEVPPSGEVAYFYIVSGTGVTVSMSRDITVPWVYTTSLNLSSGNLSIGAHTLTIDGTVSVTSATLTGSTSSNIVYSGGISTILPVVSGGLHNLSIDCSNPTTQITMTGAVTVNNALTLNQGVLVNSSYLTLATGVTIYRAAEGMVFATPTFSGVVDLVYTGNSPITAGKELPTGSSVIRSLTTNPGGFTQYAYSVSTTNLLNDALTSMTINWSGNITTTPTNLLFAPSTTALAGGTSPEARFYSTETTHSDVMKRIYRGPINTTGYTYINASFRTYATGNYVQNYPTYIELQSATSTSGPWHDIWAASYAAHAAQAVSTQMYSTDVGGNMYVSFAFEGDPYALDYWDFDNLVIDGVAHTPITSSITVNGTLNLVGNFTIGSGNTLTMANNATINRSDGALSASPAFGTLINLIYSGSNQITTGFENPGTGVNNLTVDNAAGISLDKDTFVNSTTFSNGNIVFNDNILTLNNTDFAVSGAGTESVSSLTVSLDNTTVNNVQPFYASGNSSIHHTWTTTGTQSGPIDLILTYPESESSQSTVYVWSIAAGETGDWNYVGEYTSVDLGSLRSVTVSGITNLGSSTRASELWTISGEKKVCYLHVNSTGYEQPGTEIFKDDVTTGQYTNYTFSNPSSQQLAGNYAPGTAPSGYYWTTSSIAVSHDDFTSENSYTFTITFELMEQPLPVELSSFTAVMTVQNYVMLEWVTQSETGVSGYYLFRNTDNNLATAERINAFITAVNTSQETRYAFMDREAYPGNTYYYWLQNIDFTGNFDFHGPISVHVTGSSTPAPIIPLETGLRQCYPNPFNESTMVNFGLAKDSSVNLVILNAKGAVVRTLFSGSKKAGTYRLSWDGRDDGGSHATSGVYFVRLSTGSQSSVRKLVMMN